MVAAEDTDLEEIEAPLTPESPSSSSSISDEQEEQDDENDQDDQDEIDQDDQDEQDEQDEPGEHELPQAPSFKIPSRTISAVEHPCLIMNLDRGLDTFGSNPQFQSVRNTVHIY